MEASIRVNTFILDECFSGGALGAAQLLVFLRLSSGVVEVSLYLRRRRALSP